MGTSLCKSIPSKDIPELYFKNAYLQRVTRALTDYFSLSKRLRTWFIHLPELTIIRLNLFSNANCSVDWNSHSVLYASGFQCKVATLRDSVPSTAEL